MALLHDAMPALLLVALVQATQPAIALGLVPVCTQAGVEWTRVGGEPAEQPEPRNGCAHGWCDPRRLRPSCGRT